MSGPALPLGETPAITPVLVFDVLETLLDLSALAPAFADIFGDAALHRTWFDTLILYSEAMTITGTYTGAGELGGAVLAMLAEARGIAIQPAHLARLKQAVSTLPAYPDAAPGLRQLREAGTRLVTLSNAPVDASETQLDHAGLLGAFERVFSIDTRVRRYKPARETYLDVARELGVRAADLCLVSCHAFDVMGARAAGLDAALILRPGNAPLALGPQPSLVVPTIPALAQALAARAHTPS